MGFVYRHVLEQSTVHEAIEVIRKLRRSQSMNFLLAHSSGEMKDLETTIDDERVLEAKDGYIAHTNHYVNPDFQELDLIMKDLPDSPIRLRAINELANSEKNKITIKRAKDFLRDHTNYPQSICRHQSDDQNDRFKEAKTTVSMISELDKGVMHAAMGSPCKNQYYQYQI
jgi:isopenicillin-N N-acyltransferase-like protein